eukprot:10071128-Prorocentrum_lima.AAC.1
MARRSSGLKTQHLHTQHTKGLQATLPNAQHSIYSTENNRTDSKEDPTPLETKSSRREANMG